MVPQPVHLARLAKPLPTGGVRGSPVFGSWGRSGLPQTGQRPKSLPVSSGVWSRSMSVGGSAVSGSSMTPMRRSCTSVLMGSSPDKTYPFIMPQDGLEERKAPRFTIPSPDQAEAQAPRPPLYAALSSAAAFGEAG